MTGHCNFCYVCIYAWIRYDTTHLRALENQVKAALICLSKKTEMLFLKKLKTTYPQKNGADLELVVLERRKSVEGKICETGEFKL